MPRVSNESQRRADERKRWANKSMARPRFQFGPGGEPVVEEDSVSLTQGKTRK